MSREMSVEAWRAFLLEGTRTGKLATRRKDGRPHVTPIWFLIDGDKVVFTTHETSGKALAIKRDPRVCMCVDDSVPPFSYVVVEGVASLSDDLVALREWAGRIGGRYMGADRADEYGARNGVPGELLVRITPTRVIALADIAG